MLEIVVRKKLKKQYIPLQTGKEIKENANMQEAYEELLLYLLP